MKNVTLTERVETEKYVNIETGETLASELKGKGESLVKKVPTGKKVMKFENFVSSNALLEEYVGSILKPADYKRLRIMACWLHTDFNIVLSGNNRPHTSQTLSKAFGISVDETTRLIRRLEEKNLAVWSVYPDTGHDRKVLMLNPYYIRKRKQVDQQWLTLFSDFQDFEKLTTPRKKESSKNQPVATA